MAPTQEVSNMVTQGNDLRLTYTIDEAAVLLGLSRNFVYEQVRNGTVPSIKIGRRRLVPRVGLERMLEGAG